MHSTAPKFLEEDIPHYPRSGTRDLASNGLIPSVLQLTGRPAGWGHIC